MISSLLTLVLAAGIGLSLRRLSGGSILTLPALVYVLGQHSTALSAPL
jgi:hypothetical protein